MKLWLNRIVFAAAQNSVCKTKESWLQLPVNYNDRCILKTSYHSERILVRNGRYNLSAKNPS